MVIKTGIVKYKDREDILCTYGVLDDGKQYYFLDNSTDGGLSNGNQIASTLLIEAVDPMVRANNIGVIDANGNEVIPFVNRSIRLIGEGILLVETSVPTTPSVIEANQEKNNPTAATKLVSTPAQIKEKMNQKMGNGGRYVFNDQFSEATLYDENGNNLINGEYFSFIGISDGKLFLSKNVVDSPILVYSMSLPEKNSTVQNSDSQQIDVEQAEVSKDVIEEAFNSEKALIDSNANGDMSFDNTNEDLENQSSEKNNEFTDESPAQNEENNEFTDESPVQNEENNEFTDESPVQNEENNEFTDESPVQNEEVAVNSPTEVQEVTTDSGNTVDVGDSIVDGNDNVEEEQGQQESVVETTDSFEQNNDESSSENEILQENTENDVVEQSIDFSENGDLFNSEELNQENSTEEVDDFTDSMEEEWKPDDEMSKENGDFEDDSVNFHEIEADTIDYDDFSNPLYDSHISSTNETIMDDLAKSMSGLLKQNRNLKETLVNYEKKLNVYQHRMRILEQKNISLSTKYHRLESSLNSLEEKVRAQAQVIESQTRELKGLRPQGSLYKLLEDAHTILEEDNY